MVVNYEIEDVQQNKYWESETQEMPKKKKFMDYDDILKSMQLQVSKDGVLQKMSFKKEDNNENFIPIEEMDQHRSGKKTVKFSEPPIDPNMKNSYIYNKLFSNYKGVQEEKVYRKANTPQEYKNIFMEEFNKRRLARLRANRIKSTKMNFNISGSVCQPKGPNANMNKFFIHNNLYKKTT